VDQGRAEGVRAVSRGRAKRHAGRVDPRRRRPDVRQGEAVQRVEGGVFEIALRHRGDAFRAIYTVKIDVDIWVIHAFQKKSKSGVKTPQAEVDVIRERLKRLKEALK
jgi:phage-related protein